MKDNDIVLPSNKKFGYFFSFLFFAFASYLFLINNVSLSLILIFLSIVFFLVSILKPSLLHLFNYFWMYLSFFIGKIISTIILCVIFYLIFTPVSILMKCLRRDELRISKKTYQSYWRIRKNVDFNRESLKNQY